MSNTRKTSVMEKILNICLKTFLKFYFLYYRLLDRAFFFFKVTIDLKAVQLLHQQEGND